MDLFLQLALQPRHNRFYADRFQQILRRPIPTDSTQTDSNRIHLFSPDSVDSTRRSCNWYEQSTVKNMSAFLALYRSLLYNRMWKTADWLVNHFSTLSLKYNVHFNYLNALNFWMVSNILLAPTFLFENVSLISFCDSALWEQSNINLFKPRLEENISIRNYVSK